MCFGFSWILKTWKLQSANKQKFTCDFGQIIFNGSVSLVSLDNGILFHCRFLVFFVVFFAGFRDEDFVIFQDFKASFIRLIGLIVD